MENIQNEREKIILALSHIHILDGNISGFFSTFLDIYLAVRRGLIGNRSRNLSIFLCCDVFVGGNVMLEANFLNFGVGWKGESEEHSKHLSTMRIEL